MVEKVRKRIRSRSGNEPPPPTVVGTASAAARETAPRIPLQLMSKRSCHGLWKYLLRRSLSKTGLREGTIKNQTKRAAMSVA